MKKPKIQGRTTPNGQVHTSAGRVLIYSHDTYGLGHLRRSMLVAAGLASVPNPPAVLIATGSPRAQAFDLPPGCDTVKLPAVTKAPTGEYRPRTLNVQLDELVHLRSEILKGVAESFAPDLILVDHSPVGMRGELWPLFDDLGSWDSRPIVALGLRDITDEAEAVEREWHEAGVWEALDAVYDRILVYGDPVLRTTAQDLNLSERFPGKVTLVGYLGRPITASPSVPDDLPTIVVTAGGGGDGHHVFTSYLSFLEGLEGSAAFRSVLVTGPFLSRVRQREVVSRSRALGHPVEVLSFTDQFEQLLGSAAGVVSMAGYNTVVEILVAGVPALFIPRLAPRKEQWVRAQRLAALDGESLSVTDSPDPPQIARFVERVLQRTGTKSPSPLVRMDGLDRTVAELLELLAARERTRHRFGRRRGGKRVAALA